jgi:hypothetical protein
MKRREFSSSTDEIRYYEGNELAARNAGFYFEDKYRPSMFTLRKKDGTYLTKDGVFSKDYRKIRWSFFITISQKAQDFPDTELVEAEEVIHHLVTLLEQADAHIASLSGGHGVARPEHAVEERNPLE